MAPSSKSSGKNKQKKAAKSAKPAQKAPLTKSTQSAKAVKAAKPAKTAKTAKATKTVAKTGGLKGLASKLIKKAIGAPKPAPVKAAPSKAPLPVKGTKPGASPAAGSPGKKGAPIPGAAPVLTKSQLAAQAKRERLEAQAAQGRITGTTFNDSGEAVCREVACEGLSSTGGYCRMHYIKNWKKIKRKELILKEHKLNRYIEELVAKYPDKYIEAIRQDLGSDKDFATVIADLDLDESIDDFDAEGESAEAFVETGRRDFDDDGDAF